MSENRADNRVPVKKSTWRRLHRMRNPGETYDQLLNRLMDVFERLDSFGGNDFEKFIEQHGDEFGLGNRE